MKNLAAAIFLALGTAGTASADGLSDPVVDPVVIQQAAAESSAPSAALVLALAVITVFGAAAAN